MRRHNNNNNHNNNERLHVKIKVGKDSTILKILLAEQSKNLRNTQDKERCE